MLQFTDKATARMGAFNGSKNLKIPDTAKILVPFYLLPDMVWISRGDEHRSDGVDYWKDDAKRSSHWRANWQQCVRSEDRPHDEDRTLGRRATTPDRQLYGQSRGATG